MFRVGEAYDAHVLNTLPQSNSVRRNTTKKFARLMLLTLGIGVVAVALLSLPRHTSASPTPPPPLQVQLYINSGSFNACWYPVTTIGVPGGTPCYTVPTGRYFVITDIRFLTGPTTAGDHIFVQFGSFYFGRDLVADANGYADFSDDYFTGYAVAPSFFGTNTVVVNDTTHTNLVSYNVSVTGYVEP